MKSDNKLIGDMGEKFAVRYLKIKGYKIILKNYSTIYGEIDIIATKKNVLVFIEVKSRRSLQYGIPCESVNYKKQNKIIRTAKSYIKYNNIIDMNIRFDVVEVYINKLIKVNHIKDAFRLDT